MTLKIWTPPQSTSQEHPDQFTHFSRAHNHDQHHPDQCTHFSRAHNRDRQRQTDKPRYMCSSSPHLMICIVMWPKTLNNRLTYRSLFSTQHWGKVDLTTAGWCTAGFGSSLVMSFQCGACWNTEHHYSHKVKVECVITPYSSVDEVLICPL